MATRQELIASLDPAYWEWVQSKPNALRKLQQLISQARQVGWQIDRFLRSVQALRSYGTWVSGAETDDLPPGEEEEEEKDDGPPDAPRATPPVPGATENGDGTWTLPNGAIIDSAGRLIGTPDILATLQSFLRENELPETLIGFIRSALEKAKPYAQIIAELRQTPEYLAAYPENAFRSERGLSWMSEAEIRAYRDEAKRLAFEYLGVAGSNEEIAQLIGRGTSLSGWEHRLQINDLVERYGEEVQQVYEQYTGSPLSDERLYAYFDPEWSTPEIDRIVALAQMRGVPAEFGFGIRPEEEILALEQIGIDPNRVIENYRTIAGELPRFERIAAIGGYLDEHSTDFFGDVSVSGSLLWRAVQLGDPKALLELQRRSAEESARYVGGGGPARGRTGQLAGLEPR